MYITAQCVGDWPNRLADYFFIKEHQHCYWQRTRANTRFSGRFICHRLDESARHCTAPPQSAGALVAGVTGAHHSLRVQLPLRRQFHFISFHLHFNVCGLSSPASSAAFPQCNLSSCRAHSLSRLQPPLSGPLASPLPCHPSSCTKLLNCKV